MYQYHGFGLNIASEIEMPELIPYDFENADVTISIGSVPERLDGENVVKKPFSSIGDDEYILDVRNTCRYYAGYGHTVIVEPCEGADERSVRLFMLGSIMAAILYQRGSIPLHASAIVKDEKLILFAGNSGAGKSTLLAHLSTRGYKVFTDDVCVLQLDMESNTVYGVASYPMIKLWEDAIHKIGDEAFDKEFRIRPQLPKYGHFFHDSFLTQPLPVDKIFLLHPHNSADGISYKNLNALQAFKQVEKQAYRYSFATGEKLRSLHFSLMSSLTGTVPVIEMNRPASGTGIAEFSDLVETLL